MLNSFKIGEVIEVKGTRAKVLVEKNMNHATFIYHGEVINNITVNAFIIIKQGIIDIVGKIDGEYITDLLNNQKEKDKDNRFSKGTIHRIIEVQIVGYIDSKFNNGIKNLPMIGNVAYIPTNKEVFSIYSGNKQDFSNNNQSTINIGTTLLENAPVELPINSLIGSHIGVFGNTGSGKSNTLTNLYYELFKTINAEKIIGKSKFFLIDFNGEYTKDTMFGLTGNQKQLIELSTNRTTGDKLKIKEDVFFNAEILSILFSAAEQTQKPFINRVVKGIEWATRNGFDIGAWAPNLLRKILTSVSPSKDALDLFKESINELFSPQESDELLDKINQISWFGAHNKFYIEGATYFNGGDLDTDQERLSGITECYQLMGLLGTKSSFEKLIFRFRLQLISDLLKRHAQFDHINPLINRGKSRIRDLEKVLELASGQGEEEETIALLQIISLRDCNIETKKIVPLLLAKMTFDEHKRTTNQSEVNKTIHLIIDEAHNILSAQSNREAGEWKDYRLDLFEEIIKEGRKFGFFLTISSQRPADISPTIISQIHNFFIHRLVNNKDLELLDNTITTLDRVSKNAIPTLAAGSCIITGTAFVMPVFANISYIKEKGLRPSSDNVNLLSLWEVSQTEENLNIEQCEAIGEVLLVGDILS
ncbi:ATP-binding protein [Mesobacillus sp. LC4]